MLLAALGGARFAASRWHLSYPAGAGVWTFVSFLMSWAGLRMSRGTLSLAAGGMAVSLLLLGRIRRPVLTGSAPALSSPGEPDSRATRAPAWTTAAILVLTGLATVLSIARAYASWDGMAIWSVKGYGIAREATVMAAADWGSHGLAYPLNVPLQISLFELAGGDRLPQSKLIFPVYYLALLVGLRELLLRRTQVAPDPAALLLLAAAPLLFDHATSGYANLPFSTYLVLGFLEILQGVRAKARRLVLIGGLMLGLATWTRPEGVYLVGLGGMVLWFSLRKSGRGGPPEAFWLTPVLLLALPWQAFSAVSGFQDAAFSSVRTGLSSLTRPAPRLVDTYWILRYFAWQAVQPQFWGIAVPASALLLALRARGSRFDTPDDAMALLGVAAAIFLAVGAYYFLAATGESLKYLLSTSVERLLMPGMILLLVGVTYLPVGRPGSVAKQ
jgi:hypothetical protein